MVWRETGIMDERLRFVVECLSGDETMVALCAAYGISRKNGYKWLGRYREFGPEGLHDLPRAPLNQGRATAQDLVERILAAKELHPLWGPKKIVARLRRTAPEFMWPSASTVGAILARHGLVSARKRPRLRACGNGPWPQPLEPNAVWTGDHKGWFRTRDGCRCEPLTVMDASSRYPAEASVRRVRHNGEIRWNGGFIYVSQALAGEPVAALETEDGQWTLSFHAHPLGIIDTRHMKLVRRSAAPTNPLGAAADA